MNNILILGANSDIAEAVARKFASSNYSITLASRNIDPLRALQADLTIRYETEVHIAAFDATSFMDHEDFYRNLHRQPDVVVCAFGYLGEQDSAQSDWSECQRVLDTNFSGAVSILNIIANDFEERKAGIIVGISSVAGDRGRASNYIYGCAKAGFTSYLSGLRNRLYSSQVHVVTVKPGFVNTKMIEGMDTPVSLTAEPAQVANAIWKSVRKKRNVVYVKGIWWLIMGVIQAIPEGIFKRMKL